MWICTIIISILIISFEIAKLRIKLINRRILMLLHKSKPDGRPPISGVRICLWMNNTISILMNLVADKLTGHFWCSYSSLGGALTPMSWCILQSFCNPGQQGSSLIMISPSECLPNRFRLISKLYTYSGRNLLYTPSGIEWCVKTGNQKWRWNYFGEWSEIRVGIVTSATTLSFRNSLALPAGLTGSGAHQIRMRKFGKTFKLPTLRCWSSYEATAYYLLKVHPESETNSFSPLVDINNIISFHTVLLGNQCTAYGTFYFKGRNPRAWVVYRAS